MRHSPPRRWLVVAGGTPAAVLGVESWERSADGVVVPEPTQGAADVR